MQKRAAATRRQIIEGAAEVFSCQGYSATSLNDICEMSDVTSGSLYFHFRSKEDIALAIIDAQHRKSYSATERITAGGHPALETMILLCNDLAKGLQGDVIVRAGISLTMEVTPIGSPVVQPYQQWLDTFEALAAKAQVEGDIRSDIDAATLARFIIPTFTGIQHVSGIMEDRQDLLVRIQEMWELLLPSIVTESRSESVHLLPAAIAAFMELAA